MNFTYNIGPGPVIVNLDLEMNFTVQPIWNVIAEINPTNPSTNENIIIGGHRDAWVFGTGDPSTGMAGLLEVGRCFGELLKQGWTPKRKIIFASWDGEEYGLIGSTYYADSNPSIIDNALVYINVDGGVRGPTFSAQATHSLDTILREVSEVIIDPNTNMPVSSIWDGIVGTLGSGSDYTSFLHHHGVPSIDFRFAQDSYAGVYHSVYDCLYWMQTFGDPGFHYHVALAQFWGILTLRFADSEVLPFDYEEDAGVLTGMVSDTQTLLEQYGGTGQMDLDNLRSAAEKFSESAQSIDAIINKTSANHMARINAILFQAERQFLGPGLPGRPYYRHVLQAPGLYLGYDTMVFPGLSQAIIDGDWVEARAQETILAERISAAGNYLKRVNSNEDFIWIVVGCVVGFLLIIVISIYVYWTRIRKQVDYTQVPSG